MFSRGRSSCWTRKPHGCVSREVVWSLTQGRHWGAPEESLHWGGTSLKSRLSNAWGCAVGERKTPEKVCPLCGDCFSTSQPLQGLLQKIQFLSLRFRSNTVCVWDSQVCFPYLKALFIPSILLSTDCSDRLTLFSATPVRTARWLRPASCSHS